MLYAIAFKHETAESTDYVMPWTQIWVEVSDRFYMRDRRMALIDLQIVFVSWNIKEYSKFWMIHGNIYLLVLLFLQQCK